MRNILNCRRTFICVITLASLLALGLINKTDVSLAMASVAVGLAAANAHEGRSKDLNELAPKRYTEV